MSSRDWPRSTTRWSRPIVKIQSLVGVGGVLTCRKNGGWRSVLIASTGLNAAESGLNIGS